jgi:putative membrane protein
MNTAPPPSRLYEFLERCLILAVGVTLATKLVPGIQCEDSLTLFVVVMLLSLFNAVLKPVLVIFTLPLILVTMGLGMAIINALLLFFVGRIVPGFVVDGFGSAIWGALVISATNLVASFLLRRRRRPPPPSPPPFAPPPARRGPPPGKDDVIDI